MRQNSDLANMLNIRIFLIEKHKILAKSIHILPVLAGKAAEGAKYDTFSSPDCINILFT